MKCEKEQIAFRGCAVTELFSDIFNMTVVLN